MLIETDPVDPLHDACVNMLKALKELGQSPVHAAAIPGTMLLTMKVTERMVASRLEYLDHDHHVISVEHYEPV
jgi:hypothetical protein